MDEIHLYYFSSVDLSLPLEKLVPILSQDEQMQLSRFSFRERCQEFIFFRAMMRLILSQHLRCDPHRISFAYGLEGKPFLDPKHHYEELQFNLSHAKRCGLIAVASCRRVGVDIEFPRSALDYPSLTAEVLSQEEKHHFFKASEQKKAQDAFLHYWTKKEALVKGVGCGLTVDLSELDFGSWEQECSTVYFSKDCNKKWTVCSTSALFEKQSIDRWVPISALAYEGSEIMPICHSWISSSPFESRFVKIDHG